MIEFYEQQTEAALANPDLKPGQIRELEGRLKKLHGAEAEYAGAIEAQRARKP